MKIEDLQEIATRGHLEQLRKELIGEVARLVAPVALRDEYLTIKEVCDLTKVHRSTVMKWISEGKKDRHGHPVKLPFRIFSNEYRIRSSDLDAYGLVGLE